MEVKAKVALVTGGASGLGLATAKVLLNAGMQVAIFDLNQEAFDQEYKNQDAAFFKVDVSDESSVEDGMAALKDRFASLHLCINCAGIAPAKRILDRAGDAIPLAGFAKAINVNLIGSFNVARCAAALMALNAVDELDAERGLIINTASVAAYDGQIGQCAYSASKGGIVSMTLPMARDLANLGIRVNAIAPGIMGTPMLLAMPEKVQDALVSNVQFPKRLGYPEEFARLALHMAENAYINAEVIRLDGALRMPPR